MTLLILGSHKKVLIPKLAIQKLPQNRMGKYTKLKHLTVIIFIVINILL